MRSNLASLVVIFAAVGIFIVWSRGIVWTPGRIAGLSIAAPALVMLVIARLQLGSAFSAHAKASVLVTTGLYSRIRNPIYVFSALVIVGMILFIGQPWLFLFFAVLIPVQFYRSRKESQVLEAKFGEDYRRYRQKTWF